MITAYSFLGVSESATLAEIRAAYRKLALQYHPDRNPGVNPQLIVNLNRAYEVLKDVEERRKYDAYLATQRAPQPVFSSWIIVNGMGVASTSSSTIFNVVFH